MAKEKKDERVDAIVKALEIDSKQFGGNLIKAAEHGFDKERTELLVGRVRDLMKHRNNLFATLEKTKREIELFDSRIKAIEAGEFTLESYTGTIRFKDMALGVI